MDNRAITVLVVDDDEDIRLLVRVVLEGAGMQVIDEAVDGLEALIAIERLHPPPVPAIVLLDNRMPGLSGLEVAERVLQQFPDQRIVLFTAFLSDEIEEFASGLGISACAAKADVARLPALVAGVADAS